MNKLVMILPIVALGFVQLQADDSRDQVRSEILRSLDEAVQARQITIDELREIDKNITASRAERENEKENVQYSESEIVEAREIGKISQSVASVEIAKIDAKDKIVKAIGKVENMESENASEEAVEKEKAQAVKKIINAVAHVEITKENTKRAIIQARKNIVNSQKEETYSPIEHAAVLKMAKNISAVQIAKSVSAVEIRKAVADVEIAKTLIDNNVTLIMKERYKDLSLEEIKVKAKSEISTIMASMEVVRAKSLSDIAKIVSFVEIAKAIDAQKNQHVKKKDPNKIETYSRKFIRMQVK